MYQLFTDAGHAWLQVPIQEIKRLNLEKKISKYSYVSKDKEYLYLEEDCDMLEFMNAKSKELNILEDTKAWFDYWKREIEPENYQENSFVRLLKRFILFWRPD